MLFLQKVKIKKFLSYLFLVLFGVTLRLLPHPPNFAPIGAISLFSGVYLNKKFFWLIPILAMLMSDFFIGFYEVKLMIAVYGSFILMSLLGFLIRKQKSFLTIICTSLLGSFLFYLITNFAVWAFTPWYSKDLEGLIFCYFLALPFFKNTLLGDLFYTFLLFGVYEAILNREVIFSFLKNLQSKVYEKI